MKRFHDIAQFAALLSTLVMVVVLFIGAHHDQSREATDESGFIDTFNRVRVEHGRHPILFDQKLHRRAARNNAFQTILGCGTWDENNDGWEIVSHDYRDQRAQLLGWVADVKSRELMFSPCLKAIGYHKLGRYSTLVLKLDK